MTRSHEVFDRAAHPPHCLRHHRARIVGIVGIVGIVVMSLGGCGAQQLMPTPNLYLNDAHTPYVSVAPALQNNTVDVLYATDREPLPPSNDGTKDGKGSLEYGVERSPSLAFGSCVVSIGKNVAWDTLVRESTQSKRDVPLPISIASITELGRFPASPYPVVRDADGIHLDPGVQAEMDRETALLHEELSRRLADSPGKEVLIFVHGFNNTFEDAVTRVAELSHFLGREIVPIAYTWPAGAGGGFLRGYERDTESAEFTVFHFKHFMKAVASCPDVKRINLLAHSRGTAVATAAMRELFIESGGLAGAAAFRNRYKIHNAIIAAGDMDIDVIKQRMPAEYVGLGVDRMTLYICDSDKALGISGWLFNSIGRLGQLQSDQLSKLKNRLPNARGLAVIDARIKGDFLGHGYFQSNPAVSSDLILTLRYDCDPGAENGRPLTKIIDNYWSLGDDYPAAPAPSPALADTGAKTDADANRDGKH